MTKTKTYVVVQAVEVHKKITRLVMCELEKIYIDHKWNFFIHKN